MGELFLMLPGILAANAKEASCGLWHKLVVDVYEARGKKLSIIGYGTI